MSWMTQVVRTKSDLKILQNIFSMEQFVLSGVLSRPGLVRQYVVNMRRPVPCKLVRTPGSKTRVVVELDIGDVPEHQEELVEGCTEGYVYPSDCIYLIHQPVVKLNKK